MLWFALALAQDADPRVYEDAVDRVLDGPIGCWEWVGTASWNWDMGRFGGNRGDAVFAGRTINGVWSEIWLKPLGELEAGSSLVQYANEARFAPLIGKIQGGKLTVRSDKKEFSGSASMEQGKTANSLRAALDRIGGETTVASVRVRNEQVMLEKDIPLGDRKSAPEARLTAFFEKDSLTPYTIKLGFPDKFTTPGFPPWTITNGSVDIRLGTADEVVVPTIEAFQFSFSFFGFKGSGAQTIRYSQVVRCKSEATNDLHLR